MSDPMQEIMASFFVECEELHESLVDALQSMADGDNDVETINVAFRAVHSIKGGAGAFGLDALVDFSHQFETVMDACRSGTLVIDDPLNALFFRCSDMLYDLIRCSRDGEDVDSATSEGLIKELSTFVSSDEGEEEAEEIDFQPMTLSLDDLGGGGDAPALDLPPLDLPPLEDLGAAPPDDEAATGLKVVFSPEKELYESANEPLFLIKALADLGRCDTSLSFEPPASAEELSSLGGRLTWTIRIETEAQPVAVHEIFEFAEGLCTLSVENTAAPEDQVAETLPAEVPVEDPPAAAPEPAPAVAAADEAAPPPVAAPPAPVARHTQTRPRDPACQIGKARQFGQGLSHGTG